MVDAELKIAPPVPHNRRQRFRLRKSTIPKKGKPPRHKVRKVKTGALRANGIAYAHFDGIQYKAYESDRPVELLAYAMEVSRQADDDAIRALLDERMPGSSYRRVWVYEHMLGKAICHGD